MTTYIVGDIHGHLGKLIELLTASGLIDEQRRWIGGTANLWCMGDFFDRGPHGIGIVDLLMRLQGEAADAGGAVRAATMKSFSSGPTVSPGCANSS